MSVLPGLTNFFLRLSLWILLCCSGACQQQAGPSGGSAPSERTEKARETPQLIFDTDFGTSGGDIDDLGALAVLHALANQQECTILATVLDHNHNREALAALSAVNTFYGRADIPLGYLDGQLTDGDYNFADYLAENFAHRLDFDAALPATKLYRKLLARQPDHSVTIAVTGKLRNMVHLLLSEADAYSPMNGRELVAQKVDTLFVMGGRYPQSTDRAASNFHHAGDCVARQAIDSFPRPIVFNGFEVGSQSFGYATGHRLNQLADTNPIKAGYRYWFQNPPDWAQPSRSDTITDWSIWDQIAIHTAVRGSAPWFTTVSEGYNQVQCDGHNRWLPSPDKDQSYLVKEMDAATFSNQVIEPLMMNRK